MCTNGINATHFETIIDMTDDYVAVSYRWIHKVAHMASQCGYASASEKLHAAQSLLADIRGLLDEAKMSVEEGVVVSNGVTAKRV